MSGRVSFGCDFLHLMRELYWRSSDSPEDADYRIPDAAARLFLLLWGLSAQEVDQANELFWQRFNSRTLDELRQVMQRMADHVSRDQAAQERLVTHLAAMGSMDFEVTDAERFFVRWFQEALDLRPSEFGAWCERGGALAIGLDYFGRMYYESKGGL